MFILQIRDVTGMLMIYFMGLCKGWYRICQVFNQVKLWHYNNMTFVIKIVIQNQPKTKV